MRLDVIKHRRVSLKVPGDNSQERDGEASTENIATVIAPDEITSGSLRERRKGKAHGLRISLNPPTAIFLPSGGSLDWPPAGSPFSAGWRPPLGDNLRTSEQLNRWITNGDIQPLESLLLSGRSDLLLSSEFKENFTYGHNRSKQFISDLAEYKEKYEKFLEAVVNGDEITVRQLIDFRHLVQSRHPRTHTTTIHLSAIFERPTILNILLEKDRSLVDSRDVEGRSPLHYAAALAGTLGPKEGLKSEEQSEEFNNQKSVEEEECFDILLDFGANEALLDVEGYTPMNFRRSPHLLDMHQIRGLNQFPIRPGDNIDELIAQRNVNALREIVLAGDYKSQIEGRIFPPECRDLAPTLSHLQTRILAIHEAIRNNDQRILKQLVDSWDTVIGKDEYGRTPLHISILYGRARMARYLLLLFPRCVDIPDKSQRTSLHYASCLPDEHQRAQMSRILYRAGADISTNKRDEKNNNNKTIINIKKSKMGKKIKIKEMEGNEDKNMDDEEQFPDIEKVILSNSDDDDGESVEEDLQRKISKNGWRINKINDENKIGGNEEQILINDPFSDEEESVIDEEVEKRVLSINFNQKQYRQLEQLHSEGLGGKVWKIVKKHLGNEKLIKYIYSYRQAQNRLSQVFGVIESNDLKKLKTLLDEEIVQARDLRGLTPLHIAVLEERHEIVEFIANQFPSHINIPDFLGRTVAHYAAPQQNAIYDTLYDLGANVKISDKNGFSAESYRENPKQMVRPLPFLGNTNKLINNNKIIKTTTTNGLLSLQTIRNNINNQSMDEDYIFDPDAPLDEQIERWLSLGDVQQLEQLVLDGRAHLLKDKSSTNLASAEFLQGISQYQSKVESIHKAVEEGDVRRVKSLIDRTLLATARDNHGMTPLHKALLYGQTITVRFLLTKYPHCVNETDHAGRTALHFAAADANGEHMIKVLQKAGGDAFIEDKYGHTPFYYRTHGKRLNIRTLKDNAVINQLISGQLNRPLLQDLEEDITDWIHTGNTGKLEELVLNGYADLLLGKNYKLDDADAISFLEVLPQYQAKVQAIHKAIEQGNLRAVKLLTDRKKLAFCRDNRGLAPLHKAVVFGQTEIAKYLIRNYPQSVNSMDQTKRTPLHYSAALKDGGYMYKLMRKAGADPNTFDCNGRLPKYYLKYPGELNLERMRLDTKQALKQILNTRVAPSYLETNIQQWLREGNLAKLDQLVMSGCGDLVMDKKSNNPEAQTFLRELPSLLTNIDQIHRAIREGRIESVKQLIKNKRLALARDKHGCTPLHTAIIHEQTEIIRFLAANFPLVLNAPDYNKRTAMHYAAAARDGGHYLKILGKAGADPMAVDNEGRTPDYYRRNAVFDLKMLKERDVEELGADALLSKTEDIKKNYNEEFEHKNDSLSESADLLSLHSSGFDTERKGKGGEYIDREINEFDENGEDGIEEEGEDIEKNKFEHLLHERLGMPTSDNGLYLARTVAPILTKALAEVLLRRPANPISFISDWLVKYTEETDQF